MLKAAISAFKFKRARRDNGPSSPDAGAQSNLTESDIVRIVVCNPQSVTDVV